LEKRPDASNRERAYFSTLKGSKSDILARVCTSKNMGACPMKTIVSRLVIVSALLLSGCAAVEKQAFNRSAHSAVRTVTILEPKPSEGFGVQMLNHPSLGFGLIGASIYAAEMSSKSNSLDAAMKPLGWRLSDDLTAAVAAELTRVGYSVKRLQVPRDGFAIIKDYAPIIADKKNSAALASDAWLDLATRDPLYVANGPTADYLPSIAVTVRLVSSKDQALLYRDDIFFGFLYNAPRLEPIAIPAGAEYRFPSHSDLLANPQRTLAGVKDGVPLIAKRIAQDLAPHTASTASVAATATPPTK
jgi:hypothetical protein